MAMLDKDIETVCFTREQMQARIKELGAQITEDYAGEELVILSILRGSFIFAADLVREIDLPCTMEFMKLSSYGSGTETGGVVRMDSDIQGSIEGKHVIVVEDILDTGVTLSFLKEHVLAERNPKSVKICVMFDKTERRRCAIESDYRGFVCPNGFIVGYGLDFNGHYRNLPYVGILKEELYR